MKPIGIGLIVLSVFAQLVGYWPLTAQYGMAPLFSQFLGSSALIVMAWAMTLSTRLRGLEAVFGPLDQIYQLHKWLAVVSIGLMFLHDTLDAEIKGVVELEGIAEDLGSWGYNSLLVLIFGSLLTFIPYHWWRWTHKFIGVLFALCAAHYFLIEKPYGNLSPLALYISGFCVAGLLGYLYQVVVQPLLNKGRVYLIAKRSQLAGGVVELTLQPTDKAISHKAGQFAFLSLNKKGKDETHPFTISSAPSESGELRFSIKALGDYTQTLLPHLSDGDEVYVSRGYGHFHPPKKTGRQVWVGAGIGITPFLAWAQDLVRKGEPVDVDLYYCVRNADEAVYQAELQAVEQALSGFRLHVMISGQGNRFSIHDVLQQLGADAKKASFAYCGPEALKRVMQKALSEAGVPGRRFQHEAFEIRSGTGLWRLVGSKLVPIVWQRLEPLLQR